MSHTKVQIVDRIQVHVLGVPGECRLPHAEVEIARVDAGYRLVIVFLHII